MASYPGLVVPVNVVGFCVSAADAQQMTSNFSGTTVHYSTQTKGTNPTAAYLGSNVWRPLTDPPLAPLQAGVHLHWNLPAALTSTSVDATQSSIAFPAVPNRWLLTRFVVTGAAVPTAKSWVIESDALNAAIPPDQPAAPVTIALQPDSAADPTGEPDFNYLGQCTPLEAYAPAQLLDGPRTFKKKTGAELSAVSNGVPTFAAYYPECSSVFGFFDDLADISDAADLNLMYVVTGWYDATTNDPANLSPDLAETHAWSAEAPPSYTLYSGVVQDVTWDGRQHYVLNHSAHSGAEARRPGTAADGRGNAATAASDRSPGAGACNHRHSAHPKPADSFGHCRRGPEQSGDVLSGGPGPQAVRAVSSFRCRGNRVTRFPT